MERRAAEGAAASRAGACASSTRAWLSGGSSRAVPLAGRQAGRLARSLARSLARREAGRRGALIATMDFLTLSRFDYFSLSSSPSLSYTPLAQLHYSPLQVKQTPPKVSYSAYTPLAAAPSRTPYRLLYPRASTTSPKTVLPRLPWVAVCY